MRSKRLLSSLACALVVTAFVFAFLLGRSLSHHLGTYLAEDTGHQLPDAAPAYPRPIFGERLPNGQETWYCMVKRYKP